jgi:hypothetical protein
MENLEPHIVDLLSFKSIKSDILKVSKNSAFSPWKPPQNNNFNLKLHITFVNGTIKLV